MRGSKRKELARTCIKLFGSLVVSEGKESINVLRRIKKLYKRVGHKRWRSQLPQLYRTPNKPEVDKQNAGNL